MTGGTLPEAKLRIRIIPDTKELDRADRAVGKIGRDESGGPGVIPGSKKIGPDTYRAPDGKIYGTRAPGAKGGFGNRVAMLAGTAFTAAILLEGLEFLAPALATVTHEAGQKLPSPAKEILWPITKGQKWVANYVSGKISGLKAEIVGGFKAARGTADAARAFAILRGDTGGAAGVDPMAAFEFGKSLHGIYRIEALMERRKKVVTRDAFFYTLSRLFLDKLVP